MHESHVFLFYGNGQAVQNHKNKTWMMSVETAPVSSFSPRRINQGVLIKYAEYQCLVYDQTFPTWFIQKCHKADLWFQWRWQFLFTLQEKVTASSYFRVEMPSWFDNNVHSLILWFELRSRTFFLYNFTFAQYLRQIHFHFMKYILIRILD